MKKIITIGLLTLLLCHTLAQVVVSVGTWWQAEHDLSEKLMVYRTVDSVVEFAIPIQDSYRLKNRIDLTSDGFTYKGTYYSVISVENRSGNLFVSALELKNHAFWQHDLLSYLTKHVAGTTDSQQRGGEFLKFLQKEYPPTSRLVFSFATSAWHPVVRIPGQTFLVFARSLPVYSPPPRV